MNTETKNALCERLRVCVKQVGSGHELARQTEISRQTLENYLTGKSEPKVGNIIKISEAAGVSLEWLLRGEGPMLRDHLLAGDKGGEATSTLAHAAMAVYMALHEADKLVTPEKFEELTIAMWELDQAYGDNPDKKPDDPIVKKVQSLLRTVLKND